MPILLDDIYYFQMMKQFKPSVYALAAEVQVLSSADGTDRRLYQAKLDKLATVAGENDEQRRMAVDLLCEFQAYKTLHNLGVNPKWVRETAQASPDIQYRKDERSYPVEVKHINPPRSEDVALSRGISVGGSVNPNYHMGVVQKVRSNIVAAQTKFNTFNGDGANDGTLYLYFSQSIEAQVASYFPGSRPMQNRVQSMLDGIVPAGLDVVVQDVNTLFE